MRKSMVMVSLVATMLIGGTGCMVVAPNGAYVDNAVKSSRVGTAKFHSILGFYPFGDAGIDAAMKAGGISKVHHVDLEHFWFPLFYWSTTTKVYGE